MNEVVKYHNSLNKVEFKGFNSVEMNLFFTICSQVKEKGSNEIIFNFDQLKSLSNYSPTANQRFVQDLQRTNEKLQKLSIVFDDGNIIRSLVLFPTFEINRKALTLKVKVNNEFEFILNAIDSNFTRFELQEFVEIKAIYSKNLYRLLKQWRSVGKRVFTIESFRNLLAIPESYRMTDIDRQILKPAIKELSRYFDNLEVKKVKRGQGRGGRVVQLIFTFTPQNKESEHKRKLPSVSLYNWLDQDQ
ncbi:plasmid replication initiation protein [Enterococcus sp. PF1-24]|uniref:replication initiation protein n=1 Tax=unclassified Enterococcus TaxID=2608891 RepID=UPI0024740FBE|nr:MULTISPECIES: replication initiation protein [unclassified Enterococcus]MDH6365661.1 plasmid replication initiation protein [Enterococcus sp. PFB1-1]MDH6402754.1 plasmid replication initiation protein [Enterococcus sp. PF1-24]